MRFCSIILLSLFFLLSCSPSPEKAAISRQLQDYPESRVQDIYKSFCQDNLGPGHLIPNPESARMIEEPTFPKLNTEYLEMRKKLKMNRDTYWDISKRVLTEENEKFQDRIFNQKPRIESTELLLKDYERSLVYKNIGRNRSRGIKRYFKEKSQQLILPSINKNKNKNKIRFDKIFKTEIENSNNSKDSIEKEQNNNNDVKLNEHKYDEISHQKQGHLEG